MTQAGERIPVILLTGFLGSGKTTLLARLLKNPEFTDTAVVVNEIGAIGLDHHLVQGATESLLVLENGCVCCTARDDLAAVLADLFWNRLYRKIPRFSQVVVETTGIATPGPIAETITGDPLLVERFRLGCVITTVDALQAPVQIAQHREAVEQIMGADLLLITKADLVEGSSLSELEALLRSLNPAAAIAQAVQGELDPGIIHDALAAEAGIVARSSHADHGHVHSQHAHVHAGRIHQITVQVDKAPQLQLLEHELTALIGDSQAGLLRVKGIVHPSGSKASLVIQAAGDKLYPPSPVDLPDWETRPGFLTFIWTVGDFVAVRASLDRICPDGWQLMANADESRRSKATTRENAHDG